MRVEHEMPGNLALQSALRGKLGRISSIAAVA